MAHPVPLAGTAPATRRDSGFRFERRLAGTGSLIRYATCDSPFGTLLIAMEGGRIRMLALPGPADPGPVELLRQIEPHGHFEPGPLPDHIHTALFDRGRPTPGVIARGTAFQLRVWRALLGIPPGQTRTYAEVARLAGAPAAHRAAGQAIGANPVAWLIPCHRVVRSDGSPGGYRWGSEIKQRMLSWEAA